MFFKILKNSKGFTLTELIIVLGIVLALTAMFFGVAKYWVRWSKEMEVRKKMEEIKRAITYVYNNYAYNIDSNPNAVFSFTIQGTTYTLSTGPANSTQNLQALQAISTVSGVTFDKPERDAMGSIIQVMVSPRLSQGQVQYHVIAFVSPGWNLSLESSLDTTTGVLNLKGDDIGFAVSGQSIQTEKLDTTIKTLLNIRDIYQSYFTSLYASSTDKNIYVNRFANRNSSCQVSQYWDTNSGISNSNCVGGNNTLTGIGAVATWGLSSNVIYDAWGNEIRIDNHSNQTKNPDTIGFNIPYTARIYTTTPWGTQLSATAVGIY